MLGLGAVAPGPLPPDALLILSFFIDNSSAPLASCLA
jgi:hypothetical protein